MHCQMMSVEFPPVVPYWKLKGKFVYSFVMKFNPKGDIILFVVCRDIRVREKLFKILVLS